MAGRKASPKPDLFSMLLEKMGVPVQKKGKKGKRKKTGTRPRRPADEVAAYTDGYAAPPSGYAPSADGSSPFAEYGQDSGLGFEAANYEAAAAAGYAPTPDPTMADAFADLVSQQESNAELPRFFDEPAVPAPASHAPPAPGKLFSEEALDNSLDMLFSDLESGIDAFNSDSALDEPTPVASNVVNFPTPGAAPAATQAPVQPPIQAPLMPRVPSGPLVAEAPAATLAPSQPSDFARSGKPVVVPDILPLSQGVDLRALLATIDRTPGVAGSLLVGHDGLIIIATLPSDVDRDYLGAQVCNLYTATSVQTHKMQRGELRRMILETANGVMLVTAADMGILVVVSQDGQAMDPAAVMGAIAGALGHV